MATVNFRGLEKFGEQLNRLEQSQIDQFSEAAIKELAARLLRKVILRTPVGDYAKEIQVVAKRDSKNHKKGETYTKRINPSGKKGGTLRRGWTGKKSSTSAGGFSDNLTVTKQGNTYVIEIINPTEYASYVEFGHRTRGGKGWVEGRFMLTYSEQELARDAPRILEQKLTKFLGDVFT